MRRLFAEANKTIKNCNALKIEAVDGKVRMTIAEDKLQDIFHYYNLKHLDKSY